MTSFLFIAAFILSVESCIAFQIASNARFQTGTIALLSPFNFPSHSYACYMAVDEKGEEKEQKQRKRDKVMNFLRRMGRLGSSKDFTTAIGIDEGPSTKSLTKASSSYARCTDEVMIDQQLCGIIDEITEPFPRTTCGTEWTGFTDQVMGGVSVGQLIREENHHGRTANVLRGKVSLYNNGGFIQMACNLGRETDKVPVVDASGFDGIEMDLYYEGNEATEKFNLQATFELENNSWQKVRVPFQGFTGYGPGADAMPLDLTSLRRVGILAIGKAMDVNLAISTLRFYRG